MNDRTRTFEMVLDIDSEPATVWRALTEAEELMRWFPRHAEVKPGTDGHIVLSWGEDLTGQCNIRAWEPDKHLRMTWFEPVEGTVDPDRELAVDFFIEGRQGGTTLRLLHSGFGSDESWDGEYDSISRGWNYELRSLRHYLERHLGKARRVAMARLPVSGELDALWSRVVGQNGVFRHPAIEALADGTEFELGLPMGGTSAARMIYQLAGKDFAAVLDVLGDGILRLGLESCGGPDLELWFWLASWTLSQAELDELLGRWQEKIVSAILGQAAA